MTRAGSSALAEAAAVAQRLAVLLAAGVTPSSAWQHVAAFTASGVAAAVAEDDDPVTVPTTIVTAASSLPGFESRAWRGLAAAWSVAMDAGAPLAVALRDLAGSLRDLAQVQRDVRVALAAPVSTARIVLALPAVGVLFGMLLGFDTATVLFATPIGWGCLIAGAGLVFAAARWNRRLVAAAQPRDPVPGIGCDLLAIAMSGGAAASGARTALEGVLERCGLPADLGAADAVLELSRSAGVPAGELLRAQAQESRREARAAAQERAAALSVRLMLPLGVCVLPAFVLVGVVPLMVALVSQTVAGF